MILRLKDKIIAMNFVVFVAIISFAIAQAEMSPELSRRSYEEHLREATRNAYMSASDRARVMSKKKYIMDLEETHAAQKVKRLHSYENYNDSLSIVKRQGMHNVSN